MFEIYQKLTEYGIKIDIPKLQNIVDVEDISQMATKKARELVRNVGADERVHPNYTVGITGRYSTSKPMLQNLPKSGIIAKQVKQAIIPENGCCFVYADIKQAEPRVIAHLSQDKNLIKLFQNKIDFHSYIASLFFDVAIAIADVSPSQRHIAKQNGLALVYGIYLKSFAENLNVSIEKAKQIKDKFFDVFADVKIWIDQMQSQETFQTIGNRILHPTNKREKINYSVQGSIADVVNKAIKTLVLDGYKVIFQCHDSILIECFLSEIDTTKTALAKALKTAFALSVEIDIDISTGQNLDEVNPTSEIEKPNTKAKTSLIGEKPKTKKPEKKFCCDSFADGVYKVVETVANSKKYVQLNSETKQQFLLFDIDVVCAKNYAQSKNLPVPTYHIGNPTNGHAHLIYELSKPVLLGDNYHPHPQAYIRAIELAYTLKLQADLAFAGLLCKNPVHSFWVVEYVKNAVYTLGELAKYVNLNSDEFKYPKKIVLFDDNGEPLRHQTIFETCRKWTYREVKKYWNSTFEEWHKAVFNHLMEKNYFADVITKDEKLPVSEIQITAKAIAKWVWEHFSPQKFSEIQRGRINCRWKTELPMKAERNGKIIELLNMGLSVADIVVSSGLSRETIYRIKSSL